MKAIKMLMVTGMVTLMGAAAAHADEVVLAWQMPGYVLEEIVVTAKRPVNVTPEPAEAADKARPAEAPEQGE